MQSQTTYLRRRVTALVCLLAAIAFLVSVVPQSGAKDAAGCNYSNGLGSFRFNNQPGSCWRPYNSDSPFNRAIPAGAETVGNSKAIVRRLIAGGPINDFVVGDSERDGGNPTFWSSPNDPVYTLRCTKPWGECEVEGDQVRVPAEAMPSGPGFATQAFDHDAHMTIVDQQAGWEYDLWNVRSKGRNGGVLAFGWGGKTRIDGDGLGSDAVAARYGNLAGIIRPDELISGQINHALAMVVPCTQTYVYPAVQTGHECSDAGLPVANSAPMGAHFQLRMSEAEIRELRVPAWKKTIVRALAKYGAYTSDTTSMTDQWGFELESSSTYTSFGQADPWVQFAKSLGVKPEDFNSNGEREYWMNLEAGIPWERLRVVDVCAANGTCTGGGAGGEGSAGDPESSDTAEASVVKTQAACWGQVRQWRRSHSPGVTVAARVYHRVLDRRTTRCQAGAARIGNATRLG